MSLVLDASVTLAWLYKQETTIVVDFLFERLRRQDAWVPSLWWLEIANSLQMGLRRQRLTRSERAEYLDLLRKLPLHTDNQTTENAWTRTLALSDRHGLTAYDAAYLELALRRKLPLATLDRELRQVATVENVILLGQ